MATIKKPAIPKVKDKPIKAPGPAGKRMVKAASSKKAPTPKKPKAIDLFRVWTGQPGNTAMGELCAFIVSNGHKGHLLNFCREKGFAYQTALDWIERDKDRAGMYMRAREDRSDTLAEQLLTLADEDCSTPVLDSEGRMVGTKVDTGKVQQLRLKADNLKWAASKLKPKVYGDKLDLTAKIDTNSLSDDELTKKLATFGIPVTLIQKGGTNEGA